LILSRISVLTVSLLTATLGCAAERLPPIGDFPSISGLPDPFLFVDGTRVTSADSWKVRRDEIRAQLLYYQYGSVPPVPDNIVATETSSKTVLDGAAISKELVLAMGPGSSLRLRMTLLIPNRPGRFPVVIENDSGLGDVPYAAELIRHGYIACEYLRDDLDPDKPDVVGPAQAAYPEHDWATIAVWAWGGQCVVSYLLTRDDVDPKRIAITGHSRGGKAALLTGALDERIALVAPNGSGAGGAGCYRVSGPKCETMELITDPKRFGYWFHPRMRAFWGRVDRLPVDQHFLKALVAPRALLSTDATEDLWANPLGTQASHQAAIEVYRFLDARKRIALHMRPGRHDFTKADRAALLEFLEWQLFDRRPEKPRDFNQWPYPEAKLELSWRAPLLAGDPATVTRRVESARHVDVFRVRGRFGGWPANHGLWSWGDEILVGFSVGFHRDLGSYRHAIDRGKPEEHWLARSRDGGETWELDHPGARGQLVPRGEFLHGVEAPYLKFLEPAQNTKPIPFTHPDFAMTLRTTQVDRGPSWFAYSTDRGRTWTRPFRFPNLGTKGIAARTDYLVTNAYECSLFLTAAKADGEEGRPLCARTRDGGKTWKLQSFIGPEPAGFTIMPSTVRIDDRRLVSAVRRRERSRRFIETWESADNGASWSKLGGVVTTTGAGNPPSLIRLRDGRLCLTYGFRAPPFSIRARLSSDGGQTWSPSLILRDGGGGTDLGYTRSVERPDGQVVTIYYFHEEPRGTRFVGATIWDPAKL